MSEDQIIQLAEHFGISMRSRKMSFIDNGDGTCGCKIKRKLHYGGQEVINLVRFLDSSGNRFLEDD
jgi:hypothetical protein